MKWEMKLKKVDDLIAQSNASLFDRVKLLIEIWDDVDFLAHVDGSVDKAELLLDAKLGDYGIGFFEARSLMKHFPKRPHWVGTPIRQMLAEALEVERSERKERQEPVTRKNPVPHAEHEKVMQQLEQTRERVDQAQDEVAGLRSEIAKLKEENATLRGRITEMERMLAKQYV
jgi:DNA repair exonuclease SbcCD ATPase subunit